MIYTTIIFGVKKELGLTTDEYIFLDAVYHLQVKTGTCYAKNDYFIELLGIKLRWLQQLKSSLRERGFITGTGNSVKTTDLWNNSYLGVQYSAPEGCSTVHPKGAVQCTPTIYNENDKESNTSNAEHCTVEPDKGNGSLIPLVIKEMETLDPKNKRFYGNKTQREACDFLITEYGLELVLQVIQAIPHLKAKLPYMPSVTTPVELRDKWVKIKDAVARNKAKEPEVLFA